MKKSIEYYIVPQTNLLCPMPGGKDKVMKETDMFSMFL